MWRRYFSRKVSGEEIDEEMQAHLDIEVNLLVERGLSREEAIQQARRCFGNRTRIAEDARQAWRWGVLDRLLQDLNYALRTLRRSPAFTLAAALSLALGIGASTAVFSIADAVFLRPLPYAHPKELMWVANQFPRMDVEFLASPDYVAWRRDNRIFAQLAATQAHGTEKVLLNGSEPEELHLGKVSYNFLATLGYRPELGRDFTTEEELPNGPRAVLLSNPLWRHRFHASKGVIGKSIRLDGQTYTVIGVLPPGFVFPMDVKLDLLTTLPVSPAASHHDRSMSTWAVYGRLKPGVTETQARADLQRLFAISRADIPLMFRTDVKLVLQPLQEHRVGDARTLLSILIASVACLLLIASANVSNLLLSRWAARSGEFAVRSAIGAGMGRFARQLFTEAALLTFIGWGAGAILIVILLRGFVHYAVGELPRLSEIAVDTRVFVISVVVSALTMLLSGILPVLRMMGVDTRSVLNAATRPGLAGAQQFTKRALVVTEVALSLVLVCASTLLLQTLWRLKNDRLGFAPHHILAVSIPLKGTKLADQNAAAPRNGLVDFVRRIPGVEDAAQAECTPLSGGPMGSTFSRSDRPLPEAFHRGDNIHICGAGPGYASAAGMRVIRGRFFGDDDFHHPNTLAVINEAAARAYFPNEDPVGKQILGTGQRKWRTVVGIVSDTKNEGVDAAPAPQAFINDWAMPDAPQIQLVIRSIGNPKPIELAIAGQLRSLDAGLIADFTTMDEAIGEMTSGPRFNGILVTSFAAIAFLMAIIGVYGVLAFSVTQRTQEIGMRMALGARPSGMLYLVLREGMTTVLVGILLGLAASGVSMRYIQSMLHGVTTANPLTLVVIAFGLSMAAGIAMLLPAYRAASVDPAVALRHN